MKLTELWEAKEKPTVSFEFFPARNEKAESKLDKVIDKLAAISPDFVSVTFGAGGSTRQGSYALVKKLKEEKRLEVLPYFAFIGLGPDDILSIVDAYRDLGVDNILTVRGDIPADREGFVPHPDSPKHTSDLLEFIRPKYDLCIGAAGHPEVHMEATSAQSDIEFLKLKVDNGAEFIIANYFWDNQFFYDFLERCARARIDVPVIPGVMPIFNINVMRNLASLCGATVTQEIETEIAKLPEDDNKALSSFGAEFATNQCRGLIEFGVQGIHIYTMDRAKASIQIVNSLRDEGLI